MAGFAALLILIGDLRLILEFGSITFLLVSILMALANHIHRGKTGAHPAMTLLAILGLSAGAILILIFEARHAPAQLAFVLALYAALTLGAYLYTRLR